MTICLSLVGKEGIRKTTSGDDHVFLTLYKETYQVGDQIELSGHLTGKYFVIQIDATFQPALVYCTSDHWVYPIPFAENMRLALHPYAFQGDKHYISVRHATPCEINQYQNLAANSHDQKNCTGMFPHCFANVETRDEAVFYARNAIDGIFANHYHGKYPFQSWGINRQTDAAWTLDFGRDVYIDRLIITLRADFPHDSYWTTGTVQFDDGTSETLHFVKTSDRQSFAITPRVVQKLCFCQLQKATDESPFPALTQFEAYGYNMSYQK